MERPDEFKGLFDNLEFQSEKIRSKALQQEELHQVGNFAVIARTWRPDIVRVNHDNFLVFLFNKRTKTILDIWLAKKASPPKRFLSRWIAKEERVWELQEAIDAACEAAERYAGLTEEEKQILQKALQEIREDLKLRREALDELGFLKEIQDV
jgi:hypothetical protein